MLIILIIVASVIVGVIVVSVITGCMLSSQDSRKEEKWRKNHTNTNSKG